MPVFTFGATDAEDAGIGYSLVTVEVTTDDTVDTIADSARLSTTRSSRSTPSVANSGSSCIPTARRVPTTRCPRTCANSTTTPATTDQQLVPGGGASQSSEPCGHRRREHHHHLPGHHSS